MARRVTFDQDPIAVFLDYQLPQMIAQSREAEKNRVHEKDILQERQKIEQENFLLETQTTRGLKDLDALTKDIEAQEKKLTDIDLIPSQWELLPPKDQSEGSGEFLDLVKTDKGNQYDLTIEKANTVTGYLDNIGAQINEGKERQDLLDRLEAGVNIGKARASEVTELTGDGIKDIHDFNRFLVLTGNPFEEGSAEYQGFISQAPGVKEAIAIADDYKGLRYKDAQIAKMEAETGEILNERIKGQYGVGAVLDNDILNESFRLLHDGYSALEGNLVKTKDGREFLANTTHIMSSFSPDKKMDWTSDPRLIQRMTDNLGSNIMSQLGWSEYGAFNPTDKTLKNLMEDYGTQDIDKKRIIMDKIVGRLNEIDLTSELDLDDAAPAGIEYMKKEIRHYQEARDAYNILSDFELMDTLSGLPDDPFGMNVPPEDLGGEDEITPLDLEVQGYITDIKAIDEEMSKFQRAGMYSDPYYQDLKEKKREIESSLSGMSRQRAEEDALKNLEEIAELKGTTMEDLLAEIEKQKTIDEERTQELQIAGMLQGMGSFR